jgi:hypothetical protein
LSQRTAPLIATVGGGAPRLRGRDPHRLSQAFERVAPRWRRTAHLYVSGIFADDAGAIACGATVIGVASVTAVRAIRRD